MIYILDETFKEQYYVEDIVSLSWSEPFIGCGNFELEIPLTDLYSSLLNSLDWYVEKDGSDYTMIINKINIKDNGVDSEKSIVISGESLESILKRRVVWGTMTSNIIKGDVKARITALLNYNITCVRALNPGGNFGYIAYQSYRKIPEFSETYDLEAGSRVYPKDDDANSNDTQYTGDNIYDVIFNMCSSVDLQFRVIRDDFGVFHFSLKKPRDNRGIVIIGDFLYDYNDIEFYKDKSNYKNAAIIGGANDWPKRCYAYFNSVSDPSGLNRYESFVNASGEKQENVSGDQPMNNTIKKILVAKGREDLTQKKLVSNFSGSFTKLFQKRIESKEIQNGDILTIHSNKLGMAWSTRLTELSYGYDASGETLTPTFEYYDA